VAIVHRDHPIEIRKAGYDHPFYRAPFILVGEIQSRQDQEKGRRRHRYTEITEKKDVNYNGFPADSRVRNEFRRILQFQ
jgi:hypothetical protein